MNGSIVVFGPAHVGKSTLAGYLHYRSESDFDLNRFRFETEKLLGQAYDHSSLFSYIVDTSKDERLGIPKSRSGKLGTSRRMHVNRIRVGEEEVHVIDTPGAQHVEKERIRGMFLGDIGVFVIEASKLANLGAGGERLLSFENLDTLNRFFTPLILWRKLKARASVVAVLSKMDLVEFDEAKFLVASSIIHQVLGEEIEVLPIAIDVGSATDANILLNCERMPWFEGPTLSERLRSLLDSLPDRTSGGPLFLTVDRSFDKQGIGRIERGKVLSGVLGTESSVRLFPVELDGGALVSVRGRVRNLREENGSDVEVAVKGAIVGIDIRDLRVGDRRVQKQDFMPTKTSCLVDGDAAPLATGNVVAFRIAVEEASQMSLFEDAKIIWFGKVLSSKVVHRCLTATEGIVTLELNRQLAAVPMIDGKFLFESFVLMRPHGLVNAILVGIGKPGVLRWDLDGIGISASEVQTALASIPWQIEESVLMTACGASAAAIIDRIRHFADSEDLGDLTPRVTLQLDATFESR